MFTMIRFGFQQCAKLGLKHAGRPQGVLAAPLFSELNLKSGTLEVIRTTTFFNKLNADSILKSLTTVSNAGKRRGRGKMLNKKGLTDLKRGHMIGHGSANIKWPGLNCSIIQGQDVMQLEKLPSNPKYYEEIVEKRNQGLTKKTLKIHPLERGWSGRSILGKNHGPPEAIGSEELQCFLRDIQCLYSDKKGNTIFESSFLLIDGFVNVKPFLSVQLSNISDYKMKMIKWKVIMYPDTFDDFESYPLEMKYLNQMTSNMGKVRSVAVFVAVGNKKGVLGVGVGKSDDKKIAVKKAQKKAIRRLLQFKLENPQTINHDFFYQFGKTKVFAYKKPEGYGLVCHRGIAVCCKLIGIKNLYAKVEGSKNKQNVIKAFLLGLLEQKSYQQMADENKLHLVEIRKERLKYPVVLASPAEVSKTKDRNLLYSSYVMGGRLPLIKHKSPVERYPLQYGTYLKKTHYSRNHFQTRLKLVAEYGGCQSFLAEIYPECIMKFTRPKKEEEQTQED